METVQPLSENARRRAEQADPNGQRCLVENCPKERGVELAYVFDRSRSGHPTLMASIEWAWGMRKGTLNLDTRRNIFFLGASMLSLYRSGKWALLPSEELVDRYLAKPRGRYLGVPLDRGEFPKIEGQTFEYRFLPLCDMSTFGITRQSELCDPSSTDAYTTHVYPFDTLPTMTSHVHPNFVLLHLTHLIFNRAQDPYIVNLQRTNTHIAKVARLFVDWCANRISSAAMHDKTFVPVCAPRRTSEDGYPESQPEEVEEDLDYRSSDGDSICTPPRRIWYPPPLCYTLLRSSSAKRPSDELEDGPEGEHEGERRKKGKAAPVAGEEEEEGTSDSGSCWTKKAISSWARECPAPVEPPSDAAGCT